MGKNRFIAISEDEYNSFKHGEYEREIKNLKDKIEKLEKEKEEIAKAKAVRIETCDTYGFSSLTTEIQVLSDTNFENEILEHIKNTKFKNVIIGKTISLFGIFNKNNDYVKIGDTYYYQNEWCEKVKDNLEKLSCEVKSLEEKRNRLKAEVDMLDEKVGVDNDSAFSRDSTIIRRIINKFSK